MIQKIGKTDESIKNLQEEYGKSLQYGTELEGLKQERQVLRPALNAFICTAVSRNRHPGIDT